MLYALALKRLHSPPVFRLVTFALDNPEETREYVISPGELESFGKKAEATLDGIAEGSNVAIPTPENCSGCAWTNRSIFPESLCLPTASPKFVSLLSFPLREASLAARP